MMVVMDNGGNGNVNMDKDELSDTLVAIVVNNNDEDSLEAWFGAVEDDADNKDK